MFGSALLEVVIGLVFVFILLSLLVAQVNQLIATGLRVRARQLQRRVGEIILDDTVRQRLLSHPVVGILKPQDASARPGQRPANVANIAPTTLAKALVNLMMDPYVDVYAALNALPDEAARQHLRAQVLTVKQSEDTPSVALAHVAALQGALRALAPTQPDATTRLLASSAALEESLRRRATASDPDALDVGRLLEGIARVNNRPFQQGMETVLYGVRNLKEANDALADWFDQKLAQTRTWYGNTMQWFSLFVGLGMAVVINIDTLDLARTFWEEPVIRERVVTIARTTPLAVEQVSAPSITADPEAPTPGPFEAQGASPAQLPPDTIDQFLQELAAVQGTLNRLLELRIPIGWYYEVVPTTPAPPEFRPPSDVEGRPERPGPETIFDLAAARDLRKVWNIVPWGYEGWWFLLARKLLGLLVTAFAVAQGAPFWFDVLRRVAGGQSPSTQVPASGYAGADGPMG